MVLQEKIKKEMLSAMKAKETEKLSFLRVLSGELSTNNKRTGKEKLDELQIIRKMSNNAKELGNLVEVEMLSEYLPKMLEPKEIKVIVKNIIDVNGYSTMKEMGQIMGKIKQCKESTKIDMKSANIFIRELLT